MVVHDRGGRQRERTHFQAADGAMVNLSRCVEQLLSRAAASGGTTFASLM